MPSGLDHWTTDNGSQGNRATITSMPSKLGVVVALSHRPKCPGTACFNIDYTLPALDTIDEFCNQGTAAIAQCYYTTGTSTQTFQSGLQFIRGWSSAPSPGDPQPDLLSVWIEPPISGSFCYQGYFSAPVANNCTRHTARERRTRASVASGTTRSGTSIVAGDTSAQDDDPVSGGCDDNFNANCVMTGGIATVQLPTAYARHAFAFSIYRYNIPPAVVAANNLPTQCSAGAPTTACSWYYPDLNGNLRGTASPSGNNGMNRIFANPVQRAFMGDQLRSGPVKYLHLKNIDCGTGDVPPSQLLLTGEAASVPSGQRCFRLEMGLQGALAREQDEYPIQINIGTTSQSAVVDCDPDKPNLKTRDRGRVRHAGRLPDIQGAHLRADGRKRHSVLP